MWHKEWPTEHDKYYWFYGWPFGDKNKEAEYVLVRARITGNNHIVFIGDGQFLYQSEAIGLWRDANLPELPDIAMFMEIQNG